MCLYNDRNLKYIILYVSFSHWQVLKDGLSTLHVPYPYGFAIIILTVLIKGATFPLTKKQVNLSPVLLRPEVMGYFEFRLQ